MKRHVVPRLLFCVIGATSVAMAFVLFQTVRPYDLVRFPEGNVGTVDPSNIEAGGTITVTFPAFCNDGVDTVVHRFAEVLRDGEKVAAFELPSVTFAAPDEPFCASPLPQVVALPNYVVGQSVTGAGTFRIRNEIQYRPNPFQTVTVLSFTEPFTIEP